MHTSGGQRFEKMAGLVCQVSRREVRALGRWLLSSASEPEDRPEENGEGQKRHRGWETRTAGTPNSPSLQLTVVLTQFESFSSTGAS